MDRAFRLLNVFAIEGDPFSGNPLCVFEDARGIDEAAMQRLARQFNLSETTFVLPATDPSATARVRIFTPSFEMPFAGHPTLGTAHVVRDLRKSPGQVVLEMKVGLVTVTAQGDAWTLRTAKAPVVREPAPRADLARMLRLDPGMIRERPLWVDTGAEQLVIELRDVDAVAAARPDAELLATHGHSPARGASMAYVWAKREPGVVVARFFFLSGGGVVEDPATGSACANLGGWHIATGATMPVALDVFQGASVGRPSRLGLRVDAQKNVFVRGDVVEVGRGTFRA